MPPFLVSLQAKLIAAAVAGLVLFAGGAYAGWRWEHEALLKVQLADAKFTIDQVNLRDKVVRQIDQIHLDAAVAEAKAQNKIETNTVTLTKEITVHVPTDVACMPVGLIRVLNGAAKGSGAADLSVAPGQPDDACAALTWRSFAADIADDYASSLENSEQLNALEATILATHKAQENQK